MPNDDTPDESGSQDTEANTQRVNVDFPIPALEEVDAIRKHVGVTRQAFIKMAVAREVRFHRRGT